MISECSIGKASDENNEAPIEFIPRYLTEKLSEMNKPQSEHSGYPYFALGSGKWDSWWTKWRRGRFSPSTSVSPAKTVHSTNFIITFTWGS
jgi:hypothetical protein